jgi:hypothetical protein
MESAPLNSTPANPADVSALPKLSMFERIVRIISIPASFLVGIHYFRGMSRDGIQDFYMERGKLDSLQKEVDNSYHYLHKNNPDPAAVRKEIKGIIKKFDDGVKDVLEKDGFRHSLDYFRGLDRRKQFNIAITFGAATSIALGFFAMVAEPRNRSAIADLFHKVNKKADEQKQQARQ